MKMINCKDYDVIKKYLTKKQLRKIDNILKVYIDYINKHDNGTNDVINEYINEYGDDYIIYWYEGLTSTEDFIKELKEYFI